VSPNLAVSYVAVTACLHGGHGLRAALAVATGTFPGAVMPEAFSAACSSNQRTSRYVYTLAVKIIRMVVVVFIELFSYTKMGFVYIGLTRI
jgi:hypothetical protein